MLKESTANAAVTTPQDIRRETIIANVARFFAFVSTVGVIFYSFEVKWFTLHPVLMTFAFTYLISEGILTAREMKSRPMDRKQLVQTHLLLQFGTLTCGGFGFLVILSNKIYYNNLHFQSWHSLLGLATVVIICIEVLIGLYIQYRWLRSVLSPLMPQNQSILPTTIPPPVNGDLPSSTGLPPAKKKRAKTTQTVAYIHRIVGILLFIFGLVTIGTGFRSNFFVDRAPLYAHIILYGSLGVIAICILLAMRKRGKPPVSSAPSATVAAPVLPNTPKRGANLLGALGTTDMLSFLPTTVTAPVKDVNTAKDK